MSRTRSVPLARPRVGVGEPVKHLDNYGEPLDSAAISRIAEAMKTQSRSEVASQFAVPLKTVRRIAAASNAD